MNAGDLGAYNLKLTLELFDFEKLIADSTEKHARLCWYRVLTGIGCVGVAANAGYFGKSFDPLLRLIDRIVSKRPARDLLESGSFPAALEFIGGRDSPIPVEPALIELSFAEICEFLDFGFEFTSDEHLHQFFEIVMEQDQSLRNRWFAIFLQNHIPSVSFVLAKYGVIGSQSSLGAISLFQAPNHEAICKYADLSLDLDSYARDPDTRFSREIFQACFGGWYRHPFAFDLAQGETPSSVSFPLHPEADVWMRRADAIFSLHQLAASVENRRRGNPMNEPTPVN